MDIKLILKKNKISAKEFAFHAGYTEQGLAKALRKEAKQALQDSLLVFLCKKKGINIEELIKDLL